MKIYNFHFLFKIARYKKKVESSGKKIQELVPNIRSRYKSFSLALYRPLSNHSEKYKTDDGRHKNKILYKYFFGYKLRMIGSQKRHLRGLQPPPQSESCQYRFTIIFLFIF